jgi:hypothetical protein
MHGAVGLIEVNGEKEGGWAALGSLANNEIVKVEPQLVNRPPPYPH